jgi:poly(A) polymerase
MRDPDLIRLFDAIRAAGGDMRYVGGCVRDTLLGRPVHDIDMATTLEPAGTQNALTSAGDQISANRSGFWHRNRDFTKPNG